MSDAVIDMLEELRVQRPPVYLADEWAQWEASIGKVIAALPRRDQRWAATVLVANDLVLAMPGLPLTLAYQRMTEAVLRAGNTLTRDVLGRP